MLKVSSYTVGTNFLEACDEDVTRRLPGLKSLQSRKNVEQDIIIANKAKD